ncbi:MAG TPA: SH3 domain-containing protein [Longimicrobium sp.]|uniref:SH3 domain-containing protein n=1 Tax=Longimicrobium sp. TaxID=2029185 RepID=UPI002EDAE4B8
MADTVMGPGAGPRHTLHAHSTFNVRAKPSTTSRVVRTLRRGDTVSVGEAKDGWSPVIENGDRIGYVSRAGEALRSYAPTIPSPQVATYFNDGSGSARRAGSSRGTSRRSSAESRGYYTGPRGGCYTYSASGRKRYVDHSYCN